MKKNLIIILPIALFFLMVTAFQSETKNEIPVGHPGDGFVIPDDVAEIMDNHCFGCHNADAKSDKAKKKLMIDQLGDLSKAKLVSSLGDIADVVKNDEMPPEKFLQKYPDKALSEEDAAKLKEWAESAAEELLK